MPLPFFVNSRSMILPAPTEYTIRSSTQRLSPLSSILTGSWCPGPAFWDRLDTVWGKVML